jgi:VanZ family protein
MKMRWKWLAGVYALILVVIVFLADRKDSQFLFRPIRNMRYGDKAGHFILMGLFSLILNTALSCRTVKVWKLNLLTGSLIVALVVTLEEFSQLFIRYRSFDLVDLFFDYAGILLFGQLAYWIWRRFAKSGEER